MKAKNPQRERGTGAPSFKIGRPVRPGCGSTLLALEEATGVRSRCASYPSGRLMLSQLRFDLGPDVGGKAL